MGNTEVLARKISSRITCDTYRIQAADPYPHDYDATVERNVREQDTGARPAIACRLPALDGYDTILLGSPIWNVGTPVITTTFTEALDWRGKTVHPVTTYAMSGLGTTERDYAASCAGSRVPLVLVNVDSDRGGPRSCPVGWCHWGWSWSTGRAPWAVLIDVESGSWAALSEEDGRWIGRQDGSDILWDAVEEQLGRRPSAGTPALEEFTVGVTPQSQTIGW